MAKRTLTATDIAYNKWYAKEHQQRIQAKRNRLRNETLSGRITAILGNAKKRASDKEWDYNLDSDYLKELYTAQKGKCAISGELMTLFGGKNRTTSNVISLDRIDNSLGYVKGNVQLVTAKINFMRGKMDVPELINLCKLIAEYNRG